ncbi:hypothetical protein CNMCM6106_007976 [Aspergillus hiratsukae]|uniref:Uncharacterized protein n=1 Tax=Aspergillus hiratsukae TaxID=1194566 RepID=A0A8H6PV02_9EURO|nr:hypothetical protein CNMCM6106_007976 [Aspergillus hiratsukae]
MGLMSVDAFITTSHADNPLKLLLESAAVAKILFDVGNASAALFSRYGISLNRIKDLIWHLYAGHSSIRPYQGQGAGQVMSNGPMRMSIRRTRVGRPRTMIKYHRTPWSKWNVLEVIRITTSFVVDYFYTWTHTVRICFGRSKFTGTISCACPFGGPSWNILEARDQTATAAMMPAAGDMSPRHAQPAKY